MDAPTSYVRLQHSVVETDRAQPLTRGWSEHLGWFCFDFDDDRWVWSPQVAQMHGYRPGTVSPGTELVLSHVHPDDFAHVAETLRAVRRTPRPFSSRHRILATGNRVHDVVVSGAPFYDGCGSLVGMQGSYVDMTPTTDGFALGPQSEYDRMAARLRVVSKDGHERRERVRAATRC
ncbi:MAG TPA: PAS domain-containing protein [Mycobacterium sp.]|uniref:PAS domain-containing protein n=1 Tax=Mycobacterium sp. TaxID=1785 RepID=UPI002D68F03C|nr:PAS domain-containing protein [Mycobacterium sp.]HZU49036.1 PAS domain-containing protein [Mycobacterium sp.]